ncbi:MAG: desulfoferrodoxin family protein [Methylovulum sp.]|nr:desulfoferrodoxin family protein [Methylovulum sp.]
MERRDFIRLSVTGVGAGIIAPQALAETEKQTIITSDIYYTKQSPGRWSGKVATHLPAIEATKEGEKTIIKVVTAHEMKGYEHYIVKHVLLDKDYKYLDEHLFNPLEDKAPLSTFTLKNYSGTLYALSMCNKHDLWLNTVDV